MYDYRHLTAAQKAEILHQRQSEAKPWHALPHLIADDQTYIITGTCYEHAAFLHSAARRREWEDKLLALLEKAGAQTFAWCVLPNHYHVLARLDLPVFGRAIGRLHNGTSTQWNREDQRARRKVWHSYCERALRSERHFYVSMNYIHANPVKHGLVQRAHDWATSSVHFYLETWGRQSLQEMWRDYPVLDYGKNWDT